TEKHVLKDVWTLEQAQINSFDPLDAYHAYHIQLIKQLFNTLTDLDSVGKIIPSLATSWKTNNGKDWFFYLRNDIRFMHDTCFSSETERQFNAYDVKYTFERLLNINSGSMGISYFTNIEGFEEYRNGNAQIIEGIKVIEPYAVEFHLVNMDYNFPNLLSLPYTSIVKEKAIKFYDVKRQPVGSVPFKLGEYKANQSVSLLKNEDYWEKANDLQLPQIDKVEIAITTDNNYSFLSFQNQKINFLELNLPLLNQLKNTKLSFDYQKDVFETAKLNFYLFNLGKIKDPETRKGINYAIDRKKIQELLGEQGIITRSLYPKMFDELAASQDILTHKPEKAKELLKTLKEINLVAFDDILSRSIANQIAIDLKEYGINVSIDAVPFPVLVDRLTSGKYDIIQIYWGMLYADVNHFLTPFKTASFPPAGNNFNKYSNADFDKLTIEAMKQPKEEQVKLFMEAENIILNDMPFLLLYYSNTIRASDKKYEMPVNPLVYKFYKNAVPVK
ncbi:MAG: ABC transporter substrate-binding protein, partial [Bacteroidia bacterium]|nr:ABC transporter substrate-binding protein [Bacteroidia bacterium]